MKNINNGDYLLSVIIPVYNEEGNITELYNRIKKQVDDYLNIKYEIIFIDDGSFDKTWEIINSIHKKNNLVKGIKLSRNFGHQNALKAGIDLAKGDSVISLDGDLQQPPELIPKFYNYWLEGYDIVFGSREDTKGVSIFKKISSNLYYKILNFLSGSKLEKGSSDFRLLDRKVVEELKKFNESTLFIRGIIGWLGYKSKSIKYKADERLHGHTKYSFSRMTKFAIDGIMSFSIKPLRIATILGVLISFTGFCYIIYALYIKLFLDTAIQGWTSILVSVLFIGGIQLLCIGIVGEYVGKLFIESKKRQLYIIEKIL
ncbi:MAG: glycosyltransferase [Candidatus Marinimicrobia bacterium]|nr:glycosyltransferase [Candidatus Neomarinimicrobiota bacterium]|tara:strand:- start:532 stop:1476 length:945 start_codon:yes stop_codon:yes gene_type:complete